MLVSRDLVVVNLNLLNMYRSIQQFLETLDINKISADRKKALEAFIQFIAGKLKNKEAINLNFICTHNSRRSHFSQIWAQTIAEFLAIKSVKSYSGGTEATAVYPSVLRAFQNIGFFVGRLSENENPVSFLKYADDASPIVCFSLVKRPLRSLKVAAVPVVVAAVAAAAAVAVVAAVPVAVAVVAVAASLPVPSTKPTASPVVAVLAKDSVAAGARPELRLSRHII